MRKLCKVFSYFSIFMRNDILSRADLNASKTDFSLKRALISSLCSALVKSYKYRTSSSVYGCADFSL